MSAVSTSGDQEPPKIKFPCLYPIKIIGKAADDFQVSVIAAVERYTGTIMSDLIKVQPSRQKNYVSVTITIAATGEDQLKNIFLDLKKIESVKMVL